MNDVRMLRPRRASANNGVQTMRSKTRFIAVALLALIGVSSLGGCIIVPDGHHHWVHRL
jgi:hypothetical protein